MNPDTFSHIFTFDCLCVRRMVAEPTSFSAESYFATQPPPTTLENDVHRVREWTQKQVATGRRVVLVTVSIGVSGFHQAHTELDTHSFPTSERRYDRTFRAQCVSDYIQRNQINHSLS